MAVEVRTRLKAWLSGCHTWVGVSHLGLEPVPPAPRCHRPQQGCLLPTQYPSAEARHGRGVPTPCSQTGLQGPCTSSMSHPRSLCHPLPSGHDTAGRLRYVYVLY